MDTATHVVVGIGLAGLSHVDPLVASDPVLMAAVYIGTIAGSQAPDSDTLLRLKSNAMYIRHHRGISHSLPAILIWTMMITGIAALITGTPHIGHLALWTLIAVCMHIWQDLFNAYGTQALRPFNDKWIAWNIIHIFDPIIFTLHLIAIGLWVLTPVAPQTIFISLYITLVVYYTWRTIAYIALKRRLLREEPNPAPGIRYDVFPTYKIGDWNIVKTLADGSFLIGEWSHRTLQWLEHARSESHPAIEASKELEDIRALLHLTPFAYAECTRYEWGYEVRWTDIRYRHRKQYPFVAIALYDAHLNFIDSYVGWLSDSKLEKKIRFDPRRS